MLAIQRVFFLASVGEFYAGKLRGAAVGDWPTFILSPHADLDFLKHAVVYGAAVVDALQKVQ